MLSQDAGLGLDSKVQVLIVSHMLLNHRDLSDVTDRSRHGVGRCRCDTSQRGQWNKGSISPASETAWSYDLTGGYGIDQASLPRSSLAMMTA